MERISFFVPGEAVPQGRPRTTRTGHVYMPKASRDYQRVVGAIAKGAMHGRLPLEEAVKVRVCIYKPIPKSWPKKKREDALANRLKPTSRPDLDNYIKAILDGCCNGICLTDDSLVVGLEAWKLWCTDDKAGAEVCIETCEKV